MKNKIKILSIVALLGAIGLTSCDNEIYARPTTENGEQTLVNIESAGHNTAEWIYDALHDKASTPEDVKNALFDYLVKDTFGAYSFDNQGNVILEGYDGKSDSEKLEFIKSHKVYWDQGKQDGSTKFDYITPSQLSSSIKGRIELFKSIIYREGVKTLFEKANADSYKVKGLFYEIRFARSLANQLYTIKGVSEIFAPSHDGEESETFTNKVLIDNSIDKDDPETIVGNKNSLNKPLLHINLYGEYINQEILPEIMTNMLVSQYIYDNQYNAISRSQYRKASYISITTENKNVSDARRLFTEFVKQYISNPDVALNKDIQYDVLADAWKGVYSSINGQKAQKLLEDAGFSLGTPKKDGREITLFADGTLASEHPYYQNTVYGDLIEEYAGITLNPKTTSSAIESTFTSNGQYTIETGLEIKTNEVKANDYTNTTWGTSDEGFSALPTDTKSKLFDYTVMSDFNSPTNIDENSYLKEINGHYFLKRNISQTSSDEDTIVIKDGSNFYIVEVLEAPSQSRLTIGGESAYKEELKQESIARDIGYKIGSGSTYRTTAFNHYLEGLELVYHDQKTYDYFLTNFKDLFKND